MAEGQARGGADGGGGIQLRAPRASISTPAFPPFACVFPAQG